MLDPLPTKLLMYHLSSIINIIICIVNLCFSSSAFPASCKTSSIIFHLINNNNNKFGLYSTYLRIEFLIKGSQKCNQMNTRCENIHVYSNSNKKQCLNHKIFKNTGL